MLKKKRRTSKLFPVTIYAYFTEANAKHIGGFGRKLFKTKSAYLNALVSRDRGVKPTLGRWKIEGDRT